jgi:hypothetical protein
MRYLPVEILNVVQAQMCTKRESDLLCLDPCAWRLSTAPDHGPLAEEYGSERSP